MSNTHRYPARGHVYRRCVMCGRPFRVCNSQLARRGAKFCTVGCYHAALRAFSEALASDRLELILGRAPQKAKTLWRSLDEF
jgi:DTW domain-containing protein YfiP